MSNPSFTVAILGPDGTPCQTHGPYPSEPDADDFIRRHMSHTGFPRVRYVVVKPGLRTFLIHYDADDGDNFDLVVRAETPEEAVERWLKHFFELDACQPDTIYEIGDLSAHIGPVMWMTPGLQLVGGTRFAYIMGFEK